MKPHLLAALLIFTPVAAFAQEAKDPLALEESEIDKATKSMEEAAKNLTHILGLILRSIPQYEAPVVLPNGDILIKRVHPGDTKSPDQQQDPDSSKI